MTYLPPVSFGDDIGPITTAELYISELSNFCKLKVSNSVEVTATRCLELL